MARLSAAERAALPDRAFAYVDSGGSRRLPIYDASHVRNALARFEQVHFESDQARDEARRRLLNAAKRFKIVPVGFISNQLATEREAADRRRERALPTGFVTLMMTDIEDSTGLLDRLGDQFGELLDEVRGVHRAATEHHGGQLVEARADDVFAVFASPRCALDTALSIHRELAGRPHGSQVRVRIGLHSGYPTRRSGNYVGMAVHTTARVCDAAHGGQLLVTDDARTALTGMLDETRVDFRGCGVHRLRGIPDEVALFQVLAPGLERSFPPLRV